MEKVELDKSLKEEIDKLIKIAHNNGHLSRATVIHLLLGKNQNDLYPLVYDYMINNRVKFIEDYVELDSEMNDLDTEIKGPPRVPFDSTKINIASKSLSLEGLIKRLKFEEIDLNTEFQRKEGLWDDKTKSQLIESLMLRIPLPVFYFDGTIDEKWLIIDGLQRLSTFKEFFIDKTLELEGLEYFEDYNGCKCDDLPRTYIRRMEETQLFLYIIQPGTPFNVKFNIFKRINTPGLKLEPQEIRHALYQGKSTELLKQLSGSEEFKNATGGSISNERMLGSEVILRFLAFKLNGVDAYNNYEGKLDSFLNDTMEYINKMKDEDIDEYKRYFYKGLETSSKIFGRFAFRRMTSLHGSRKNPINVALFEGWMLALCETSEEQERKLVLKKKELIERFIEKLQEKTFSYDISSGKRIAVSRRIDVINNLVKEILEND